MRKKLTNIVIAKLEVPAGKQSVKLFDPNVGGLGVRKMTLLIQKILCRFSCPDMCRSARLAVQIFHVKDGIVASVF